MKNLALVNFAEIPVSPQGKPKFGKVILIALKTLLKGYTRPALVLLVAHVVKALTKDPQQAVEFITEVLQEFDSDLDGQAD